MTDASSILNLIKKVIPHEIYNLAAQSHVKVSFDVPEYSADVNGIGTLRILEAIRSLNLEKKVKFYQAGTSEMFGKTTGNLQNEKTPFHPVSPYANSKCFAHWITKNYRDAYGIFACNGILFNHESPIRGETFVTKKIIQGLVRIKQGHQKKLFLGKFIFQKRLGSRKRLRGSNVENVTTKKPNDYVIGTGKTFTIKDFVNRTAKKIKLNIRWTGKGLKEKAINIENKKIIIECRKRYFRPLEVDY